jgi:hypothetical protein
MPSSQDLEALRLRIKAVESGEEAERLQRLLQELDDYPHERESDLRSRLSVLRTAAARDHLLNRLKGEERRLTRQLAGEETQSLRRPPREPIEDTSADPEPIRAPIASPPSPTGLSLGEALGVSVGGVIAAAILWFVTAIAFFVLNGDVDKHFDDSWLLRVGLAVMLIATYAYTVASLAEDDRGDAPRTWTVLVATSLVAVPTASPWNAALSAGLVVPAALAGALVLWLGNRRPREPGGRNFVPQAASYSAAAVFIAMALALVVLPHPGSTAETGSGSGRPETRFCDTHSCIDYFDEGRGSIVQCADGMWSHSGGLSGACSYHGGVRGY